MDCSILGLDHEQLRAFNVIDLGPIDGDGAEKVRDTDIQYVGTEPLNFAGEAVAILHQNDVGFVPRQDRGSDKHRKAEQYQIMFHGRSSYDEPASTASDVECEGLLFCFCRLMKLGRIGQCEKNAGRGTGRMALLLLLS